MSASRSSTSRRNDLVGYQATYVATAVVNNPGGDVTKTLLTEGAREALRGDRLISQEGETPLTFTPHAPKSQINGQIIAIADEATEVGQYQIVVLNRGDRHGLAPGAVLAVDQRGEVVRDVWSNRPFGKNAHRSGSGAALRARRYVDRVQGVRSRELRPDHRRARTDPGGRSRLFALTHFR